MPPQLTQTWRRALERIVDACGRENVDCWFADSNLIELALPESATIQVPSRFHADWIQEKFQRELCASLGVRDCRFDILPPDDPSPSSNSKNSVSTAHQDSRALPAKSEKAKPERGIPLPTSVSLRPDYSFDSFVVGPCNHFAYAAAQGVADPNTRSFNPLFLHGSTGLGKTHLLQAVAREALGKHPECQVLFLTCEQFVNHFISSLHQGNLSSFREHFRSADALIVDDVQLLAHKARTQEEFFHTFNALHEAGKQIVLSCDSLPEGIPELQERLISRFKWGLVVQLDPPDYETRSAILRAKADRAGLSLDPQILDYLAENIRSNIRELEGALTKLHATASLMNKTIDLHLAESMFPCAQEEGRGKRIRVDDVISVVTEHFGVSMAELQSKRRTQSVVFPRQLAMFLVRQLTGLSLNEIGGHFGGRDHSTVLYSLQRVERRRLVDSNFSVLLAEIETRIRDSRRGS